MPAPGSMGTAYIRVENPERSETLYLPPITSVETSYYASLSELPTIVMGYRNNFIIDLGTVQKISLTMKRVNPFPYNDSSTDPEDWSNGQWYRHLEELLDYWQTLGFRMVNGDKKRTGGFLFHFSPNDTSLHPVIDKNVFLNGALNLQYGRTYMVVQMNLTVARMEGGTAGTGNYVTVILHPNIPGGTAEDYTYTTAANSQTEIPNAPPSWEHDGFVCTGWATSASGSRVYEPGDPIVWEMRDEPYELWAIWTGPTHYVLYQSATSGALIMPKTGIIQVYVIGAGGGAGGSGVRPSAVSGMYQNPGGAGGGGGCEVRQVSVVAGDTYYFTVGAGGKHGNHRSGLTAGDGSAGLKGGDSTFTGPDVDLLARGGDGGDGGAQGSTSNIQTTYGGQEVYAGGNTRYGENGGDGESSEDNWVHRGMGWKTASADVNVMVNTGAGGGASDFYIRHMSFSDGTSIDNLYSKGGDGGGVDSSYNVVNPTQALIGGGGGSVGVRGTPGDGADGALLVIYF